MYYFLEIIRFLSIVYVVSKFLHNYQKAEISESCQIVWFLSKFEIFDMISEFNRR